MTRARRQRASRIQGLTSGEWAFLCGCKCPPGGDTAEFWAISFNELVFREDRPTLAGLWEMAGDAATTAWAQLRPGTRPPLWWCIPSQWPLRGTPRDDAIDRGAAAPRLQVGGVGTPLPAAEQAYRRGVPQRWAHHDPEDWPTFESEAAYLARLKLFLPGERRRLTTADFEPVCWDDPVPEPLEEVPPVPPDV